MATGKKVVVIADIFADHITRVMKYPAEGDSTQGTPFVRKSGGCGGNIAAGLAKLGVDTYVLSKLGDDDIGHFLADDMKDAGTNIGGIVLDKEHSSGLVLIAVSPSGERTIWVLGQDSAYEHITSEDMSYLDEVQPDVIFVSGVLLGTYPTEYSIVEALEKWKGKAEICFDPNLRHPSDAVPAGVVAGMRKVCDLSDVVLTGQGEMDALGLEPHEGQIFIVKNGKEGSKLIDAQKKVLAVMPSTDHRAIDATGAGDTYAAAFVAAHIDGMGTEDAMRFATVASGISVTASGARTCPEKKEIEEYISANY